MNYNALTHPPIWVEADTADQAAREVVLILQDGDIFPSDLGGDPLTDAFSAEDGCYHIEFADGSIGIAE